MARLRLNKSTLTKQARALRSYEEFLPALDMKRRQLMAEQNAARRRVAELERALAATGPEVAARCPMLSNTRVDVTDLVTVVGVNLGEENVLGARLPVLHGVQLRVHEYAFLGKPHWVDDVVIYISRALELNLQLQVARRRLILLEAAVRSITQRVNLFDKVLIPRTRAHIKKIRIYLSDLERAAVVTSKLAKAKKRPLL